MMKALIPALGVFCTLAPAAGPRVAGNDATAIIRYGERLMRGQSTQAAIRMLIQKPDFTRKLRLRSWTAGDGRALVEILEPAKEEGISSLRVSDQMWNYLPKTDQVVRVPTSLMLQSWMGSDFTNDDLMKSSSLLRDYRHHIVKAIAQGKQRVIVIECDPKPNAPVVWGKVIYWARASDKLPVKELYYDERNRWVRTLSFDRYRKMDDRVIPTRVRVQVAESKEESTTIVYEKVLYDRVIDSSIFDKDLLRRSVQNGRTLANGWSTRPMHARPHLVVAVTHGRRRF